MPLRPATQQEQAIHDAFIEQLNQKAIIARNKVFDDETPAQEVMRLVDEIQAELQEAVIQHGWIKTELNGPLLIQTDDQDYAKEVTTQLLQRLRNPNYKPSIH